MEAFDSTMAYVVTHLFLLRIWERTKYEDLDVLLDAMPLSLDGERSMDPALVYDWARAISGKATFTKQEGFEAAKTFLRYWNDIGHVGPEDEQDQIEKIIKSMCASGSGEPVRRDIAELWGACWNEVSANLDAGEPFKTAFWYGTNEEGKPGRLQLSKDGRHEFVEEDGRGTAPSTDLRSRKSQMWFQRRSP